MAKPILHVVSASQMTTEDVYKEEIGYVPSRDKYVPSDFMIQNFQIKYFVLPGKDAHKIAQNYMEKIKDHEDRGRVSAVVVMLGGNVDDFVPAKDHIQDAEITFYITKELIKFIYENNVLMQGAIGVKALLPPPRHDNPKCENYNFYLQALHSRLLTLKELSDSYNAPSFYTKKHQCRQIYGPRFTATESCTNKRRNDYVHLNRKGFQHLNATIDELLKK